MTKLRSIIDWGYKIQRVAGLIAIVTVILTITVGIISRYVFDSPFDWTEELCTLLFIWLSFLGAGMASAKRRHVAVDFMTAYVPAKYMNIVRVICNALIIALLVLIVIGSVILMPQMQSHSSVSLNISKVYFYMPIMLVSAYMIVVYTVELIEAVHGTEVQANRSTTS